MPQDVSATCTPRRTCRNWWMDGRGLWEESSLSFTSHLKLVLPVLTPVTPGGVPSRVLWQRQGKTSSGSEQTIASFSCLLYSGRAIETEIFSCGTDGRFLRAVSPLGAIYSGTSPNTEVSSLMLPGKGCKQATLNFELYCIDHCHTHIT